MNNRNCILRGLKRGNTCAGCDGLCPYYISLHGTDGMGGRMRSANIPVEYRGYLVSDNPVRESQPKLYASLEKYVESFVKMFEKRDGVAQYIKNIYLFSESPGTGKTATASALANEYMARHYIGNLQRGRTPKEKAIYFLDCAEFYQLYTQITRPGIPRDVSEVAARKYYAMMDAAQSAEFLVMDDIGIRSESDAFRLDLHTIVNARYVRKLPTVYTSNVPMEELRDIFDDRLYDRVADLTFQYTMLGESKRGNRK